MQQLLIIITSAIQNLKEIQECAHIFKTYTPPLLYTGLSGRPRFEITEEQLCFLLESHFTVPQMAEMIGVSTRTIERRLSEYGLFPH